MMKNKLFFIITAIAILVICFFIINKPKRDFSEISINTSRKQRIISLAPNITEIIFFLREGHQLIGVTNECNYPIKTKETTKIGSFGQPSIEKIIMLKPDMLLATGFDSHPIINKFNKLGITFYNFQANKISDITETMKKISKILQSKNNNKIYKWQKELDKLKGESKKIKRRKPLIFLKLWKNSLMTAGPNTFINEIIEIAGAENIAKDLNYAYPVVSIEYLLLKKPDIIITAYPMEKSEIKQINGWNSLKAVKNNNVYSYKNPDILLRPGPRILDGIKNLQKIIFNFDNSDNNECPCQQSCL